MSEKVPMPPPRTARAAGLAVTLFCLGLGALPSAALAQTAGSAAFAKECGACHMAFPPEMLPAASWKKIIAGLADHFGEDASLTPKTAADIEAYLTANAAESSSFGRRFMAGLRPGEAPLRITEMPVWIGIHSDEIPSSVWKDPRVKSKSNCPACHHRNGGG